MRAPKTGLLLVNLGTPAAPTTEAVRPFLREFLSDPRVLSMPGPIRWLLVNLRIVPFRSPNSAAAYKKIWLKEGSPLMVYSEALTKKVRARLAGDDIVVELAMRYGKPSIERAVERMRQANVEKLIVFPLYPQYASATSGTIVQRVTEVLNRRWRVPSVRFVPAFSDDDSFLGAVAGIAQKERETFGPDHTLFSFHGIPEGHIRRGGMTANAVCKIDAECCATLRPENALCYRAQCHATARGLAKKLGLKDDEWDLAFQSRLGRAQWLEPSTEDTLRRIAKSGKKRLAVYCPAFLSDCLETLEEIGMEGKETFLEAGGEDFLLIPCVNDDDDFAETVVKLALAS